MCDGIIVFSHHNSEYILGVELKSIHTKSAHQQLKNGEILVDWITKLLKNHKHWNGAYKFFGIIVKSTKTAKNKRSVNRNNHLFSEVKHPGHKTFLPGHKIFLIRNFDKIHFRKIINAVTEA